jgi:predicted phosphodiesterase
MAYSLERTNADVLTIRHNDIALGWEQRYLLIADVHWDNPHCDRKMLDRHLTEALERNAGILCFGDWFCAMQGKYDKRSNKESIRPEHKTGNYIDSIVDTAADYLKPYSERFLMLSDGNHETSIRSHLETDLLARLCQQASIQHMGYSGFVRFMFQRKAGMRSTRRLYFHHGAGGGGPVTKGTIQTNRRAASVDADIFVSGHIHESWALENVIVKMNDSGQVTLSTQTHVQLPTYKQEFNMQGGFHIEKGRPPKPLGGWWLVFHYDPSQPGHVGYRLERAN